MYIDDIAIYAQLMIGRPCGAYECMIRTIRRNAYALAEVMRFREGRFQLLAKCEFQFMLAGCVFVCEYAAVSLGASSPISS